MNAMTVKRQKKASKVTLCQIRGYIKPINPKLPFDVYMNVDDGLDSRVFASVMGRLPSSTAFNSRPSWLGFGSRASASVTGRVPLDVVHGLPEADPAPD